jgi:hypothetical protein
MTQSTSATAPGKPPSQNFDLKIMWGMTGVYQFNVQTNYYDVDLTDLHLGDTVRFVLASEPMDEIKSVFVEFQDGSVFSDEPTYKIEDSEPHLVVYENPQPSRFRCGVKDRQGKVHYAEGPHGGGSFPPPGPRRL